MKKTATLLLCISAAVTFCTVPAHAVTLTFEDLKSAADAHFYEYQIPNGYGGLNWSQFWVLDAPLDHPNTGYTNGLVSGSMDAFNYSGLAASIVESASPFVLHSAYLAAAWYDDVTVTAYAYRNSVLLYSKTVAVSRYYPTLATYEYSNVDKVTWTSSRAQFVMDDLSYDFVPEPSSILALLCGIGGVAGIVLKRRG